jgi:rod shape-determining protein MreC
MRWFASHRRFLLVAAILLLLLVLLFASYALRDSESAVGRVAGTVVSYIQKPFVAVRDAVADGLGGLFSDEALTAENEALKEELEQVKAELIKEKLNREELTELNKLSESLNVSREEYTLLAANVVSMESSNAFDIFTIDIGADSGVTRNSVVVCGDGLVGRVLTANKDTSKVVAVIDENNKIGFQLRKGRDFLGVCYGDGQGNLSGYLLDEKGKADVGDEILTSGIGGVYPAGLVIGRVTKAELTDNSDLLQISIRPAVYFKGLKKVAVLI